MAIFSSSVASARAGDIRARLEIEQMRREREERRLAMMASAIQQGIGGALQAGQVGADIYNRGQDRQAEAAAQQSKMAADAAKIKAQNDYREQQLALKRKKLEAEAAGRIFGSASTEGGTGLTGALQPRGGGGKGAAPAIGPEYAQAWSAVEQDPEADILDEGGRLEAQAALIAKDKRARAEQVLRQRAEAYAAETGVPVEQALVMARAHAGPQANERDELSQILRARDAAAKEKTQAPLRDLELRASESAARQKVLPEIEAAAGVAGTSAFDEQPEAFEAARARLLTQYAHLGDGAADLVDTAIINDAARRGLDAAKIEKIRAQIDGVRAKAEKDRRVPTGGGAPKKRDLSAPEINKLSKYSDLDGEIESAIAMASNIDMGPISSRLKDIDQALTSGAGADAVGALLGDPKAGRKWGALADLRHYLTEQIGILQGEGVLQAAEYNRVKAGVDKAFGDPENFEFHMRAVQSRLRRSKTRYEENLRRYGRNVPSPSAGSVDAGEPDEEARIQAAIDEGW